MDEPPRRRRRAAIIDEEPYGSRRFPIWLLFPVVIIVGLGLGAGIARYINSTHSDTTTTVAAIPSETPPAPLTPRPSSTPQATTSPQPSPSVEPTGSPQPTQTPRATPSAKPTVSPRPTETPLNTATPRATSTPRRTPAPEPTKLTTPHPSPTLVPTIAPVPAAPPAAVGVVRAYLENIRRGNFAAAAQYLANGDPTETFIDGSARIGGYASRRNADGSYRVTADVTTSSARYLLSFVVDNTDLGQRIIEHSASKQ